MKTIQKNIQSKRKIIEKSDAFKRTGMIVLLMVLNFLFSAQTPYMDYFTYVKDTSPVPEGTQVTSIISTKNGYVSVGVAKGLYFSTCTGISLNFKKENGTLLRHARLFNCDSIVILGGASGLMLNDSVLFLNFMGSRTGFAPPTHDLYLIKYNVRTGILISTNVIKGQIESGGYGVTQNSTKTVKMNNGSISVLCGSYNGINVLNFTNALQLQFSRKVIILPTVNTTFEFNVSTSSFVETAGGSLFLSLSYEQLTLPPKIIVSAGNAIVMLDASFNISYTKIYDFTGGVEYLGCSNLIYKNQNLIGGIGMSGAPYVNRNAGMYKINPLTGNILSAKTIQALNNPFTQPDSNNYSPTLGVQSIQGNNYTFFSVSKNYTMNDQFLLWNVDQNLNLVSAKKSNFSKIETIYNETLSSGCLSNSGNEFILSQYVNGYGIDTVNDGGIASELFARFNSNLKSTCSKTYQTSDTLYDITSYFSANTVFNLQVNPQPLVVTSSSLILIDSIPLMHLGQRALCTISPPPNLTGIRKQWGNASIDISPNPASDLVRIENKMQGLTSIKMQIMNSLGQIVNEENFTNLGRVSGDINFSVAQIKPGIYYVKLVTDKNEVYIHKLVISH